MSTPFASTLGANLQPDGSTRFRVWAPDRQRVEVALETPDGEERHLLERDALGYHAGSCRGPAGTRYRYRLDGGDAFPDPCSRFQPEGPHGPSEVVDPGAFAWSDAGFPGLSLEGQVLYELHVGAFTASGDYAGVERELAALKELGVTCLELMPLNTFDGRFNWGYDGVSLFAPCAVYGRPDDLRRLVDAAHRLGLGVILDVVYNHLGPSGNYLGQYARGYFSDRHPKDWGDPLDLDGANAGPVRDFVVQNACQWIAEYHFDGLRLDATQSIYDASPIHIVAELTKAARQVASPKRLLVIAENEPQDPDYVRPPERGGMGTDGVWVDDFHHSARVAYSGNSEAYCKDYRGTAQELLSCALRNSLFQGQWYEWQKRRRGGPMREVPAPHAVFFLQNHDQVANTLRGLRLDVLGGLPQARAISTYFLLLPQTPLLFMGQEYFAPQPFLFFADHEEGLQAQVNLGREKFLSQFDSAREAIQQEGFHPLTTEAAFRASTLDLTQRTHWRHAPTLALHRALLTLRREDPLFRRQSREGLEGAVLSDSALALRFLGDEQTGDRLLLLNLGGELRDSPFPEPVLALPRGRSWRALLSSEETRFGGSGAIIPTGEGPWMIPGHCALVLTSAPTPEPT